MKNNGKKLNNMFILYGDLYKIIFVKSKVLHKLSVRVSAIAEVGNVKSWPRANTNSMQCVTKLNILQYPHLLTLMEIMCE